MLIMGSARSSNCKDNPAQVPKSPLRVKGFLRTESHSVRGLRATPQSRRKLQGFEEAMLVDKLSEPVQVDVAARHDGYDLA
jgi:hypothetical protein